jgi:hypothetical protein
MLDTYENTLGSERVVEIPYIVEAISSFSPKDEVLDVGGVVTSTQINAPIFAKIKEIGCCWEVSDFRPCEYQGDFVTYDFGSKKFDKIVFLSSLEHFVSCTEGDLVFRVDEDKKGFQKALSLLDSGGEIYLTVPVGKPQFVPHHMSYDANRISFISDGAILEESLIYILKENNWVLSDFSEVGEILNPGPINAVGLFKFSKK